MYDASDLHISCGHPAGSIALTIYSPIDLVLLHPTEVHKGNLEPVAENIHWSD